MKVYINEKSRNWIDVDRFKQVCGMFSNDELTAFYNISLGTLHNWKKKYGCLKKRGGQKREGLMK